MNTALAQGVERYHQTRTESDIDLIQEVRQKMLSSGLGQRMAAYDQNRFIMEAEGKAPETQRFLLNRYWSHQLMQSPKPSFEERYCLIPDGSVGEWLKLFEQKILPFVIENNLPIAM